MRKACCASIGILSVASLLVWGSDWVKGEDFVRQTGVFLTASFPIQGREVGALPPSPTLAATVQVADSSRRSGRPFLMGREPQGRSLLPVAGAAAKADSPEADSPEAPSTLWLIVMPAIPLLGGGVIYLKRRWLSPPPADPPGGASATPPTDPASVPSPDPELPPGETGADDAVTRASASVHHRRTCPPLVAAMIQYFPLIGIAGVTLIAFMTYVIMRQQLVEPVLQDLEAIADAQGVELETWFTQQRQAVLRANNLPKHFPAVEKLLQPHEHQVDYDAIRQAFEKYLQTASPFRNTRGTISLLTNGGIVTYATESRREGQYQPLQNTTTYITRENTTTLPTLYVSPLTDDLQITFATPILGEGDQRLGVLAADLDLAHLAERIAQVPDIPTTSKVATANSREIYLVGRASLVKNQIISADPDFRENHRDGVNSRGINQAISRINGSGLYLNYGKVPVIGVYRWFPRHNLALLAEVEQAEIFKPAQKRVRQILGIGFISTGILTLLLYGLTIPLPSTDSDPPPTLPNSETADSDSLNW